MLRRLLHIFRSALKRPWRDHVGLVEDEDFIAIAGQGRIRHVHADSRASSTPLWEAASISTTSMEPGPPVANHGSWRIRRTDASRTFGAVDATGQNTRGTRFTATARSGEQIGVRELVLVKRTHQRNRSLILSDHAIERCPGRYLLYNASAIANSFPPPGVLEYRW